MAKKIREQDQKRKADDKRLKRQARKDAANRATVTGSE